jgi:hypothetical protein
MAAQAVGFVLAGRGRALGLRTLMHVQAGFDAVQSSELGSLRLSRHALPDVPLIRHAEAKQYPQGESP